MTSQEFYRLVDNALAPECKRLGLSRKRGTVSLWFVPFPPGTFFYEVYKGPKSPYIPSFGGRFSVHCHVAPSSDPKARGLESSVSFMEYFSPADLETMRELRKRVLHKILSQRPTEELQRVMLEMNAPLLQMEMARRFNPHQVPKLPYLDAEDVCAWAQFLAARLEQTLAGLRDKPEFFMRVESGQQSAAPNGGLARRCGNSGVSAGLPSVS